MNQVTIQNSTSRMVVVPCNSGKNLFLAPRAASPAIPEAEIKPNARVEKLLRRRTIILKPEGPKKEKKPPAPRAAEKPKKTEGS